MKKLIFFKNITNYLYIHIFDQNIYLLVIFLLAFTIRIIGAYPGYFGHPDEPKISDAAMNIVLKLDFEPVAFYYGSLLPIIYALIDFVILPFYILYFVIQNIYFSVSNNDLSVLECFAKNNIPFCLGIKSSNFFLYLARYETAFLSSVSTILIYFLSKKLFNTNIGLIAAFLTSVNYRHVLSSHFVLADAPLTVFILLSILLSVQLIKKPSINTYIFAGFGLGLTFSVKYFIYTTFTLLLCHFFSKWKKTNFLVCILKCIVDYKLFVALAVAILSFSLINPYVFFDIQNVKEQFELNSMFYGVSNISFNSFLNLQKIPIFSLYYLVHYGLGILLTVTTIIGILVSIFSYPRSTLILLSIIFPFFYVFLIISGNTYVRNYSAILPLLTIFPAIFVYKFRMIVLKSKYMGIRTSKYLLYATCIILVYSSLKNSVILSYSFAQTNNYKFLEKWIIESLPDDSNVAKSWGTPFPGRKQVYLTDWDLYSTSYQSLSELNHTKTDWLILSSESGIYINHFLNLTDSQWILKNSFLNQKIMWAFLEDNYPSLLTRELASYRIKEFVKPFASLDPSFIVIKIPTFIVSDLHPIDLNSPSYIDNQTTSECYTIDYRDQYNINISSNHLRTRGLNVTKIPLGSTIASANKLYEVTTQVSTDSANNKSYRSSFMRLDFYSSDEKILKTYVSNQIKKSLFPQTLTIIGFSPKGTSSLIVTFQLDECNKNSQKYSLQTPKLYESTGSETMNLKAYPYFYQDLSRNFIWQPPL